MVAEFVADIIRRIVLSSQPAADQVPDAPTCKDDEAVVAEVVASIIRCIVGSSQPAAAAAASVADAQPAATAAVSDTNSQPAAAAASIKAIGLEIKQADEEVAAGGEQEAAAAAVATLVIDTSSRVQEANPFKGAAADNMVDAPLSAELLPGGCHAESANKGVKLAAAAELLDGLFSCIISGSKLSAVAPGTLLEGAEATLQATTPEGASLVEGARASDAGGAGEAPIREEQEEDGAAKEAGGDGEAVVARAYYTAVDAGVGGAGVVAGPVAGFMSRIIVSSGQTEVSVAEEQNEVVDVHHALHPACCCDEAGAPDSDDLASDAASSRTLCTSAPRSPAPATDVTLLTVTTHEEQLVRQGRSCEEAASKVLELTEAAEEESPVQDLLPLLLMQADGTGERGGCSEAQVLVGMPDAACCDVEATSSSSSVCLEGRFEQCI